MPQLLVITDLPEAGGKVVYRERIVSSDFESRHFTGQLAERLGWAVRDAHELAGREEDGSDSSLVELKGPASGR
jgi:hypothetical protein